MALLFSKKFRSRLHKARWAAAVKRRLATLPPAQAQALVAKKLAADKKAQRKAAVIRSFNLQSKNKKIAWNTAAKKAKWEAAVKQKMAWNAAVKRKMAFDVSIKKGAVSRKAKWEEAVKRKLASMPPEQAQALVIEKMYPKPAKLVAAETADIGGDTRDAIADAAIDFGMQPEIQETIADMEAEGYSNDEIMTELNNSQVMQDMTSEVARAAVMPQMQAYYSDEGYDDSDAYYMSKNVVDENVNKAVVKKKGVGAVLLPVAAAALMVMG